LAFKEAGFLIKPSELDESLLCGRETSDPREVTVQAAVAWVWQGTLTYEVSYDFNKL